MKTLYEQLSAENIELIKKDFEKHQTTYSRLLLALRSTDYYEDLRIKHAMYIWFAIYPGKVFDLQIFSELFKSDKK